MSTDRRVGFVVNSGGRGTLDLLWSCIITIILCTWKVQRLQIVHWSHSKKTIFRKKAFWMFITLLCPEYVTWVAFEQWNRARKYKEVCRLGHKDWTMQQGFYVDMGGVELSLDEANARLPLAISDEQHLEKGVRMTIRLEELITLMKADIVPLPTVTLQDLEERSKQDRFARVITSVQVFYFVVNCCQRTGSNLPISTLEVSTLAFICCGAFIEFFWWRKPLDIRTSTVITLLADRSELFWSIFPALRFNAPEQDLAEVDNFKLFSDRVFGNSEMRTKAFHLVWIGCIFNGIHILAWNFSFASQPEHLLWQIFSVGACVAIVLTWAGIFIRPRSIGILLASLFGSFYCVCRIYLMVEVFVGLRSVPAALYEPVAWQNVLPGV
ncbi:hypothetical protein H2200_013061 [Cladophialophora chaetospira]|uniref:Uncharacterized protein n=1 Tax=Cladophialophora chaetospira TaxID=386627 RepID=A0AA38WWM6_9EURO|nr:hypothetical protein H2200_013061 [Cladophialophora chaetospira]